MARVKIRIKQLTQDEHLQRGHHEYQRLFGTSVTDLDTVTQWMVATGRFRRSPPTQEQLCRKALQRALRKETYVDPQGRTVRLNHFVRGEQQTLSYDIREANEDNMKASIGSRRLGILADVRQTKRDLDSWNDNNRWGKQLEFSFDFNKDLVEDKQPTTYPDEKPENDKPEDE